MIDPQGYIDFLKLTANAKLVLTDSGGIQEETTFLGVQCLTVRENTERPVTIETGTNQLCGTNLDLVNLKVDEILEGKTKQGAIPYLWDGKTADRIVNILINARELDNTKVVQPEIRLG